MPAGRLGALRTQLDAIDEATGRVQVCERGNLKASMTRSFVMTVEPSDIVQQTHKVCIESSSLPGVHKASNFTWPCGGLPADRGS